MRTTASFVGRVLAALVLALGLTILVAGAAEAATNSNSNSNSNSNTNSVSSSSTGAVGGTSSTTGGTVHGASTLSHTGAEMWIPLTVGGVTVLIALGARRLSRSGVL